MARACLWQWGWNRRSSRRWWEKERVKIMVVVVVAAVYIRRVGCWLTRFDKVTAESAYPTSDEVGTREIAVAFTIKHTWQICENAKTTFIRYIREKFTFILLNTLFLKFGLSTDLYQFEHLKHFFEKKCTNRSLLKFCKFFGTQQNSMQTHT